MSGDRLRSGPNGQVVIVAPDDPAKLIDAVSGKAAPRPRDEGYRGRHHRQQPAARRDRGNTRRADVLFSPDRDTRLAAAHDALKHPSAGKCRAARQSDRRRERCRSPIGDAEEPLRRPARDRQQSRAARRNRRARQRHRPAGQEPARRVRRQTGCRSRAEKAADSAIGAITDQRALEAGRHRCQSVPGVEPSAASCCSPPSGSRSPSG